MFDEKTVQHLQYYVYALFDPEGKPFYVGKGTGNRVFAHVEGALVDGEQNLKYETIRAIHAAGDSVRHLVIRHGMDEATAFAVESALIDFAEAANLPLSNLVLGHNSVDCGLMSAEEIIRRYNASKLLELDHPVVIININRTYKRGSGPEGLYDATRKYWVISEARRKETKFALAEYRGLIAEVYEIEDWFPAEDEAGKRWGFSGRIASDQVRSAYVNRSIAYSKAQGAANPIRYSLIGPDYLFRKHPQHWGLRGDPHLWSEMKQEMAKRHWPESRHKFQDVINSDFAKLTGKDMREPDDIFVDRYDTGGMSSGLVSTSFWRDNAVPLLLERFTERDET